MTDPFKPALDGIIKVEDKRDEIPLEEVQEQIEQAMSRLLQTYIDEVKGSAKIVDAGKKAEKKADKKADKADEAKADDKKGEKAAK